MFLLRLVVGLFTITALFFSVSPPRFLGSHGRLKASALAVLGSLAIFLVANYSNMAASNLPTSSRGPAVSARSADIITEQRLNPTQQLIGCNAFKTRLNEGLKLFGDIRPAIQWRRKPALSLPDPDEETVNFPESENALACDENGMFVISAGLYIDTPVSRQQWRSFIKAITYALDPQSVEKNNDLWRGIDNAISADLERARRETPQSATRISGYHDLDLGIYHVSVTEHLNKEAKRESYVAQIVGKPRVGYFSYSSPDNRNDLLACDTLANAIPEKLIKSRTSKRVAHLIADEINDTNGRVLKILCDARGRLRAVDAIAPNRSSLAQNDLIKTMASAGTLPNADLRQLQDKAAEDLKSTGGCQNGNNTGSAYHSARPYNLSYYVSCDGESMSLD